MLTLRCTCSKKTKMIIFGVSAVLDVLILDLILKYAIKLEWIMTRELIPGVLALTKHENFGLLGNLPIPFWLIMILTLFALAVLGMVMKQSFMDGRPGEFWALSYVLGGALGNLIDRIVNGYVFDWILLFNTSIINIADIAITLGIAGYAGVYYLRSRKQEDDE
ncbi:MAG: signal peptidase II [Patescibacteria group bacterium]